MGGFGVVAAEAIIESSSSIWGEPAFEADEANDEGGREVMEAEGGVEGLGAMGAMEESDSSGDSSEAAGLFTGGGVGGAGSVGAGEAGGNCCDPPWCARNNWLNRSIILPFWIFFGSIWSINSR